MKRKKTEKISFILYSKERKRVLKSIKPGRGPSLMNGVGSIAAGLFGIFWTFLAVSMGAPWFFVLFGIIFVGMAIAQAIYNLNNATNKNRFSEYDIVEDSEEHDPMQEYINNRVKEEQGSESDMDIKIEEQKFHYCPYCGAQVNADFEFCSQCGKKLSD